MNAGKHEQARRHRARGGRPPTNWRRGLPSDAILAAQWIEAAESPDLDHWVTIFDRHTRRIVRRRFPWRAIARVVHGIARRAWRKRRGVVCDFSPSNPPSASMSAMDANTCEHGDHPAPDGRRFCSIACERCEHESTSENGCDRICLGDGAS